MKRTATGWEIPMTNGFRILQLTDMQIIDGAQQRRPDRLKPNEAVIWRTENIERNGYRHIREAVERTSPNLIILTGDLVYGEFDDSGVQFDAFLTLMDSFGIPWAPVFGNHDNESARGIASQCDRLESAKHCLFLRGNVTGYGNYTVTLTQNGVPARILFMMDSHGCSNAYEKEVRIPSGLKDDQIAWIKQIIAEHPAIPFFVCFHIPTQEFGEALVHAGYQPTIDTKEQPYLFSIEDFSRDNGDFGFKGNLILEKPFPDGFHAFLKKSSADGLFVGHHHNNAFCVSDDGIRYVFGLKTGTYDFHLPGKLGSTLITLNGTEKGNFTVENIYTKFPE